MLHLIKLTGLSYGWGVGGVEGCEDDVPAALVNISMRERGDDSCSSWRFTAAAVRLGLSLLLSRRFHLYFLFIYYAPLPPPAPAKFTREYLRPPVYVP